MTHVENPSKTARGGKRKGAGRPHGSGKYGEPTKAIRIPESLVDPLKQHLSRYHSPRLLYPQPNSTLQPIALFEHKVSAGFPSPADDHVEKKLDLNEHLIKNPASTFFVRVDGNSMIGAGIHPNDLLVVDFSLTPHNNNVVVVWLNGEFTIKRLMLLPNEEIVLVPENPQYAPITVTEDMDFKIWGVVTNVVHRLL